MFLKLLHLQEFQNGPLVLTTLSPGANTKFFPGFTLKGVQLFLVLGGKKSLVRGRQLWKHGTLSEKADQPMVTYIIWARYKIRRKKTTSRIRLKEEEEEEKESIFLLYVVSPSSSFQAPKPQSLRPVLLLFLLILSAVSCQPSSCGGYCWSKC